MLVKTKHIFAYTENYGQPNAKFIEIDEAINNFLEKEKITYDRLIDIKYSPIGYFQPDNGEGELHPTVLIIYTQNK